MYLFKQYNKIIMETKEVKLQFLKEDFNSNYYDTRDCAVTRALSRAGFDNLEECGNEIWTSDWQVQVKHNQIKGFTKMYNRVLAMYSYLQEVTGDTKIEEPKDFVATLHLPLCLVEYNE